MIESKEDHVRIVSEDGTSKDKLCTFWMFTSCIYDVLKFRFQRFEKIYQQHIHDIDVEKFTCQREKCGKSFEIEQLYLSSYEDCPECIVGKLKLKQSSFS